MKVRFIKSPSGQPFFLAHNIGDVAVLSDELGFELLEAKIVEEFEAAPKAKEEATGKTKAKTTAKK